MSKHYLKRPAAVTVTFIAVLGLSGCGQSNPNLDSDVEQLAKLPALTSTALVLRGPAYIATIALAMLGMNGLKVKIKTKRSTEEEVA